LYERITISAIRHRDFGAEIHAVFDLVCGVPHHQLRRIQLECLLDLAEPAHAVRKPCRPEPHLTELVAAAALAEHVRLRYAHVGVAHFGMAAAAAHGLHVANDLEAGRRQWHDEGAVASLRDVGVRIAARDDDREVRAVRAGREPFVAVDHPLVAVFHCAGLNLRRVGAGHLGLGHREARA
jgi:hypothetical protein